MGRLVTRVYLTLMDAKAKKKLLWQIPLGIFVILAVWKGPALWTTWKGVKKMGLLEDTEMREYTGSTMDNLKAMHTALMIYHDSEGMFPEGDGWMDAIEIYIKTGDMSEEEAEKKLKNPIVVRENPDGYGYAYNDRLSTKYVMPDFEPSDDPEAVQQPDETVLVFDSSDTSKNASGDPKELAPEPERQGGNLGVSVSGNVVELDKLLGQ